MSKFRLGDITGFTTPDPMVGPGGKAAPLFPGQQEHQDTCAIRSQEFIIKQFTGHDIPEDTLIQEAEQNGWYQPGHGTSQDDVGKLLELHGIPVNRYEHANIFNLTSELAQGHRVIIGVDSEELWKQHPILHEISGFFGLNGADHAVVVSGIDTSDPEHIKVIISDPGTGDAAKSYPMDQFVEAWEGSDFTMVTTQNTAPSHLPEMANFDYATGNIGNYSYGELLHHVGVSEAMDTSSVSFEDATTALGADQEIKHCFDDEINHHDDSMKNTFSDINHPIDDLADED